MIVRVNLTTVSTTFAVVTFSCIKSVDSIKLWSLTGLVQLSRDAIGLLSVTVSRDVISMKTRNVIGAFRSVYCHR